jgi:hypothetical protein
MLVHAFCREGDPVPGADTSLIERLRLHRQLEATFDRQGILDPGKVLW